MIDRSLLTEPWYYTVEVEKGVFTKGSGHQNIALTRKLLRNVNVQNKSCLDIGTMEAIVPILFKKAGAARVVAYDRLDLSQRIALLKDAYGVDFEYIAGLQLHELPARLDQTPQGRFFDLVVLSGVLYHMLNPLGLLALVRGLCKAGSLMLIETAAVQNSREMLVFNARGEFYAGKHANYFLPTTAWLDYALRMLGLLPLQALHIGQITRDVPFRLALLCRSQTAPCPLSPADEWVFREIHSRTFLAESQFDWETLARNRGELDYRAYDRTVLPLDNTDLYTQLGSHARYIPTPDELILKLDSEM